MTSNGDRVCVCDACYMRSKRGAKQCNKCNHVFLKKDAGLCSRCTATPTSQHGTSSGATPVQPHPGDKTTECSSCAKPQSQWARLSSGKVCKHTINGLLTCNACMLRFRRVGRTCCECNYVFGSRDNDRCPLCPNKALVPVSTSHPGPLQQPCVAPVIETTRLLSGKIIKTCKRCNITRALDNDNDSNWCPTCKKGHSRWTQQSVHAHGHSDVQAADDMSPKQPTNPLACVLTPNTAKKQGKKRKKMVAEYAPRVGTAVGVRDSIITAPAATTKGFTKTCQRCQLTRSFKKDSTINWCGKCKTGHTRWKSLQPAQ